MTLIKLLKDCFDELAHYLITELNMVDNKDVKYNVLNETNADGDRVINIKAQHFNQTLSNF